MDRWLVLDDLVDHVRVRMIKRATAKYFGINVSDLNSDRREKELWRARAAAMYLCREMTKFSYPALGRAFNRDYSSVIRAVKKVEEELNAKHHRGGRLLDGNDSRASGE